MPTARATRGPFALSASDRARLRERVERAIGLARRVGGRCLASITTRLDSSVDPCAVVVASRATDERWFCFEQPERAASALAALGSAADLEARGTDRFSELGARWRTLVAQAIADPPDGPPGAGPVAVGGFAFAPDGGDSPAWTGFAAASLTLPALSFARRGGDTRMTINAMAGADDLTDQMLDRVESRLEGLRAEPLPLLDPDPAEPSRVRSAMPPEHYEEAVDRAAQRIRSGELDKLVLAREVQVITAHPHDPGAVFGVLRDAFPGCFVFAVGRGQSTFLAASPELLIRREGLRASTLALAGSMRRSADPAVDDHLGEQLLQSEKDREEHAIVVRRIRATLKRAAVWVTAAEEPVLARMANIQHLATPIRAQLADPVGAVELAGRLHPTPAVGGDPVDRSLPLIPALEGLDRGWYAGPVGWIDANEDGEFCVALRCSLLADRLARCYAGVGVVRDSDPRAELAETEVKFAALLPVLAA
ncbi:MAG: isochorismate synthase [Actinobacteria bacterium]|nr:MAG: isochorismate synthase [Actinomycetota bacterium]